MLHYTELTEEVIHNMELTTIRNNKKKTIYNIECGFDIETSSVKQGDNKSAFMYIWQFGIGYGNPVYYGRTWEEFTELMLLLTMTLELSEDVILPVYVHNLSYEFQFMRAYLPWADSGIFAVAERKPIKALTTYGIEFRDSYILSGYSLANTAKNLTKYKVDKMVGDLDYSLIRHHTTPLTEKEMKYCENDIVVILAYIKEQIELHHNDINKLPMTNTGRVRKFVKDNCYYTSKSHKKSSKGKFLRYSRIMSDLTLTLDNYMQCKRAFQGGFTHSNPILTNKVLTDVDSVDLSSSYPTVMLAEKFPMSRPKQVEVKTLNELKQLFRNNCVLFDVKFEGLKNNLGFESYLSESKCANKKGVDSYNGRIMQADEITTTITDVDFKIIEAVYSWDNIAVSNVQAFRKNYLPKSICTSILELYEKKTTLKDVEGYETEYLLSKGMLNSVYGMSVTDFIKDDNVYNGENWHVSPVDANEKIEKYNTAKTRFLYYPWGLWVTAYARANLWGLILETGNDYIYSDTDSVKMLNYEKHKPFINDYNKFIGIKLEKMIKHHKLDNTLLTPKSKDGKIKPLGIWDYEGHYTKFKTLGAKRYLLEKDGKFHLTVAGLSKQNGMKYIVEESKGDSNKVFKMFNDGLYVPANKTGKMTHTYLDDEHQLSVVDFNGVREDVKAKTGVHLENTEFTLSIEKTFKTFLDNLSNGYIYKGLNHI